MLSRHRHAHTPSLPELRLSRREVLALEGGTLICGAPGTGKSTSSGAAIAEAFLDPKLGAGGLVLCATATDVHTWLARLNTLGRQADCIRFSGPGVAFNFLEWGRRAGLPLESLVALFAGAAEIASRQDGQALGGDHRYWVQAMEAAVRAALVTLLLARDHVSFHDVHQVLMSGPEKGDLRRPSWQRDSFCAQVLEQARAHVARVGTTRHRHSLHMAEQHWQAWAALNDRTKSSILNTFTSAVSGLLSDPLLYEKFSCGLTVDVAWTHQRGTILLMDLPAETYGASALIAQTVTSLCWQWSVRIAPRSRVTFYYADEFALFATASMIPFLQLSRGQGAVVCAIVHSLPELEEKMGRDEAAALIASFRTFILHGLSGVRSQQYFADLIGKEWRTQTTRTRGSGAMYSGLAAWLTWLWPGIVRWLGAFAGVQDSASVSVGETYAYRIEPSFFGTLRSGAENGYVAEAVLFQAGKRWEGGTNYQRVGFVQDFARGRGRRG